MANVASSAMANVASSAMANVASSAMANAVPDISLGAELVTKEVETKAEEIHDIVNRFREFRRAANGVVSCEIAIEIQAVEDDLLAAEATLREAGERIDRVAKEVATGNRGAGQGVTVTPFALTEATNLVLLDRYPKHKKAREEWLRQEAHSSSRLLQAQGRIGDATNQIFQLIWGYAVFLGVVLTAVSQLSQTSKDNPVPVCGKIWFPIVLTVFGTLVTIGGIFYKFPYLKKLQGRIEADRQVSTELLSRLTTLDRLGPRVFDFGRDVNYNLENISPKSLWFYKILVIVSVTLFSGVLILSYFAIMCDTWTIREWDKGLHR